MVENQGLTENGKPVFIVISLDDPEGRGNGLRWLVVSDLLRFISPI